MNAVGNPAWIAESEGSSDTITKLAAEEDGRAATDIPGIPINLYDHKLAIVRHWAVLLMGGCFLPVALYFILKYAAHAKASLGNTSLTPVSHALH
jgi:hypothetical protein